MRFLVDECFPRRLVVTLRGRGHDVTWASDVCRSQSDVAVLAMSVAEDRIVITEDRDYGDLAIRDGHPSTGIVIAHVDRFPGALAGAIDALCERIDALGDGLVGHLTVIEPTRIRQRSLKRL